MEINYDRYNTYDWSDGGASGNGTSFVSASTSAEAVTREMVFGTNISSNPIPEHTYNARCTGMKIGFSNPNGKKFAMNETLLSKHLLLLGGIGSGKTNVFNFILESLIRKQSTDDIIFVFDTKGDFYRTFSGICDDPVVIANSIQYRNVTRSWNIFQEIAGDNADESVAKEIAKQLFVGRGSEAQPFFELAAADLVSKVLIDFIRRAIKKQDVSELTNKSFVAWLHQANMRKYVEMIRRNPDFASAMLYFGDPGQGDTQKLTAQALGVFGYINAMVSDLFTGIFANSVGPSFSMRSLVKDRAKKRRKTVVFIEYDLKTGEVLSPMYRLLIDLAMKEALGQQENRKGNVYFVIDEFKLLPNLMHIDDALNFGRSLGVRVFAGLQSIDQMYANYGESRGKTILSGFMNSFCFETPDANSRKYISERFGENYSQLVYHSNGQTISVPRSGFTVEDWDIRNLRVGQAAVDLVGEKPFIFQFSNFEDRHSVL